MKDKEEIINEMYKLIEDKEKIIIIKNIYTEDIIKLRLKNINNVSLKTIAISIKEKFNLHLQEEFQYDIEDFLNYKFKLEVFYE